MCSFFKSRRDINTLQTDFSRMKFAEHTIWLYYFALFFFCCYSNLAYSTKRLRNFDSSSIKWFNSYIFFYHSLVPMRKLKLFYFDNSQYYAKFYIEECIFSFYSMQKLSLLWSYRFIDWRGFPIESISFFFVALGKKVLLYLFK